MDRKQELKEWIDIYMRDCTRSSLSGGAGVCVGYLRYGIEGESFEEYKERSNKEFVKKLEELRALE